MPASSEPPIPPIPPSSETNLHPDLPYLQNHDVALLYAIIEQASQSPNLFELPFRSIFAAYDSVLAQHGIQPQHDQIYLRFLFRLGERFGRDDGEDGEGKDLFTEFGKLLWELGIRIEFGSSEGSSVGQRELGMPEVYEGQTQNEESRRNEHEATGYEWTGTRRERRASFSGVFEVDDESTNEIRRRADSRASESRLQDHSAGFGSRGFKTREKRKDATQKERREDPEPQPDEVELLRGRMRHDVGQDGRTHEENLNDQRPRRTRESLHQSDSTAQKRRSSRKTRRHGSEDIQIYEDTIERDDIVRNRYHEVQHRHGSERTASTQFTYRPSETQLLRDADTFYHFHLSLAARDLLRKWKALALSARDRHEVMERHAMIFDRTALLRQGFEQWRQFYLVRKNEAETERFFQSLGDRVSRARDEYLLTKAFTHWAECAGEEAEKSAVARRHIIRLRYFNAWKEITADNELKVRNFRLQRFVDRWRSKLKDVQEQSHQAIVGYQKNLVEKVYWDWFWTFCERRAPEWRNARLKQQFLHRWLIARRARAEQQVRVGISRNDGLCQQSIYTWFSRTRSALIQQQQAVTFHRRSLLKSSFAALKRQTQYAPLTRRVQGLVNWRVASTTLSTALFRTKLYQRAREVDRQRTVRNAWTTWNDRLRCQTLQNQIADRLAVQALYKWVLAERGALLTRLNQERMQERALEKIVQRKRALDQRLQQAEDAVVQSRNRRLLTSVMNIWRAKNQLIEQNNAAALEFETPRAAARGMIAWHNAQARQAELDRVAVESAFYLRTTRSLRVWNGVVHKSQKKKRRDAYIAVRRIVKKNLAQRVFGHWRQRTAVVEQMRELAEEKMASRESEEMRKLFETWKIRLSGVLEMEEKALEEEAGRLLGHTLLGIWIPRTREADENASMAETFLSSKTEKMAYDYLRRMQLKALECHSQDAKAGNVFAWNEKRRVRGVVRGWAERAQARRRTRNEGDGNTGAGSGENGGGDNAPLLPLRGMSSLLGLTRTPRSSRVRNLYPTELDTQPEPPQLGISTTPSSALMPPPRISEDRLWGASKSAQIPTAPTYHPLHPATTSTFDPSTSLLSTPLLPNLSTPSHRAARARGLGAFARSQPQPQPLTQGPQAQPRPLPQSQRPLFSHSRLSYTTSFTPASNPGPATGRITEESSPTSPASPTSNPHEERTPPFGIRLNPNTSPLQPPAEPAEHAEGPEGELPALDAAPSPISAPQSGRGRERGRVRFAELRGRYETLASSGRGEGGGGGEGVRRSLFSSRRGGRGGWGSTS